MKNDKKTTENELDLNKQKIYSNQIDFDILLTLEELTTIYNDKII